MTEVTLDDELMHIGVLHKSGRYPWGSGENPSQRNRDFLANVEALTRKGMTETEVAQAMGINSAQLRNRKTIAKTEQRAALQSHAQKLSREGMSNIAIGKELGLNESRIRSLLDPAAQMKNNQLVNTMDMLKSELDEKRFVDIGVGVEHHIGMSRTSLLTAVAALKDEGYQVQYEKVKQLGTGKETTITVLRKPDVDWLEVKQNPDKIGTIGRYSTDQGSTFNTIKKPLSIDPKRVAVRYGPDGGEGMDGVIQVRRGKDDVSLGGSHYAQVRVAVGDGHYLKGMAMYADDLPDGVDIRFNTNKTDTGNKLDAMKPMKIDKSTGKVDEANPFGSQISRQILDGSAHDVGSKPTSTMNIVNEQGDWNEWSKSISSQVLSKQSPILARKQLDLRYAEKLAEFDEIKSMTNPAVKKRLLESYSDDLDASAVHLKAAALPRQRTQVILPINSLSDREVYAPNFRDGESVVLVRYPHGGKFEIPELTVNNSNREARSVIPADGKKVFDAIGINANVASRLSGADFDGDTVLVIPNNSGSIKTQAPLKKLQGFDPKSAYPKYEGMPRMSSRGTQVEMGKVSNLITDMTIKGATQSELARAVAHSMVVIDAEKHYLNFKQSAKDNGIDELKRKYQSDSNNKSDSGGSSTIISRAKGREQIDMRKARPVSEGGPIDKRTGEKKYVPTGETYERNGKTIVRKEWSTKMTEAKDARTLISDAKMPIEREYADYANRVKALANNARKEMVNTKSTPYSPTAKKTYSEEVAKLRADLQIAQRNAPRERQAQLLANNILKSKMDAEPGLSGDKAEMKKVKNQALNDARNRMGAKKVPVPISPKQWEAIQAGAVSNNMLQDIMSNTDLDKLKELAMPRERPVMNNAKASRAKAMQNAGYTPSEIADQLGVPVSTLYSVIKSEG